MALRFEPVQAEDFEALARLRAEALRDSLERLGRFSEEGSRERLAAQFQPEAMRHICWGRERVGLITVIRGETEWVLQHLYISPRHQGQGIGAWALDRLKLEAAEARVPIRLSALKQSDANRFYLRHGFEPVGESPFDIDYHWTFWRSGVGGEH